MTDVYWHTRRRLWSVREGGRVIGHEPDVALGLVTFVVREAGVARIRLRRQREVCAWATGTLLRYATAEPEEERLPILPGRVRIRFQPFLRPDFHTEDGRTVTGCTILGLWEDGTAWGWECRYA